MNRVTTPTLLQLEMTECGAASLGMVLAYHGLRVPLEQLRIACGVSRDGSRASNVLNAARRYGLIAKGFKKEPEDLKEARLPVIVFWNFNHFLVVEGFGKNKVYLNDPAMGRRSVTDAEFSESFTGIVLTFTKGAGFRTGGRSRSALLSLARRLRGSYSGLWYAVLATLCLAIPACLIPVFSRVFVDSILIHGMIDWLHPLAMAMLAVSLLAGFLTFLQQRTLFGLRQKLAISGSAKFFWHVLRLPIAFYAQRSAGEIGARLAINDRLASLLSGELATSLVNLLLLCIYGALLLQYDVPLTLIAASALAINLLFLQWTGRRRKDQTLRMQMEQGKLSGISSSGLQTIETLKAMGAESDFFARWAGTQAKVVNAKLSLANNMALLSVMPALLIAAANAAVLGLGGRRVMDGTLTIGMLTGYQALMSSFLAPVNQLVNMGNSLAQAGADITQLDDVLLNPPGAQTEFVPVNTGDRLDGSLEFRNVTFGYSRLEEPLIRDFNLTVRPGQRIALVGGSGSGKSTLAKLAAGLFDPWSGEVLLSGKLRPSIPRGLLTNSIALVDQDIVLFRATIRENLTMWEHGLPMADVVQAAKDACIHDDITSRNGGYEHMTEESARDFSGGQRQRLEIARALAGNPRLLIMDEATSALDAYTEKLIDDNVRRRGCACLIVAHRLSTVRDCDEIVVLERGVAVERGRHEELMAKQGVYAGLIEAH